MDRPSANTELMKCGPLWDARASEPRQHWGQERYHPLYLNCSLVTAFWGVEPEAWEGVNASQYPSLGSMVKVVLWFCCCLVWFSLFFVLLCFVFLFLPRANIWGIYHLVVFDTCITVHLLFKKTKMFCHLCLWNNKWGDVIRMFQELFWIIAHNVIAN